MDWSQTRETWKVKKEWIQIKQNVKNVKMNVSRKMERMFISQQFQNGRNQRNRNAQNVHSGTNQQRKEMDVNHMLNGG